MIKLIIKRFIKDYQNVNDKSVREAYGVLSGTLGIICNMSLFVLKLLIGLSINSIAVITDAFNNFTDLGSSLISIVGAKLSNRPPDREHPYGHGRFEYIGALVVSFIIFSVGFQLLRNAFDKIINPEEVLLNPVSMVILILSVTVKLWMFSYNNYIGKAINSSINKATAYDSLSDVVGTSAVIVTTILGTFVDFPIDGIVGVIISLLILYTGFSIAKDTVNLILGSSPDPELVDTINSLVTKGKYIIGTHDLKIHDYGPGRIIASIHAEAPDNIEFVEVHSVIDELEEKIADELGVNIVIHMDPVSTDVNKNNKISKSVISTIHKINTELDIQNLIITDGENKTTLNFDLLMPSSIEQSEYENIRNSIAEKIAEDNNSYNVLINMVSLSN